MSPEHLSSFDLVVRMVELILIPILYKIYTTLALLLHDVSTLKTILIGTDGKNGIRSRVRRLERKQEQMSLLLASKLKSGDLTVDDHEEEE